MIDAPTGRPRAPREEKEINGWRSAPRLANPPSGKWIIVKVTHDGWFLREYWITARLEVEYDVARTRDRGVYTGVGVRGVRKGYNVAPTPKQLAMVIDDFGLIGWEMEWVEGTGCALFSKIERDAPDKKPSLP